MKAKQFGVGCCIGAVLGGAFFLLIYWSTGVLFSTTLNKDSLSSPPTPIAQHQNGKPFSLHEFFSGESLLVRSVELRKKLVGQDTSQLMQLLEQSFELEKDQDVTYMQDQLIESIARIDPSLALETVWSLNFDRWNSLVSSVFTEWTTRNFHQALQIAASLKGTPRKVALMTILETKPDEMEVLKTADSIGIVKDVELALSELRTLEALHDPHEAFDLVFSDSVNDIEQASLLITIAESWAGKEGTRMFHPLLEVIIERYEATYANDYGTIRTLSNLIAAITPYHPETMWELILTQSAKVQSQFAAPVLVAWGQENLQQALEALEELEKGELQGTIYRALLRAEAIRAPQSTLNIINDVPLEHRRITIAWAIRQLFQKQGAQDAIVYLTTLKEQGENVALATRFFVEEWAKADPEAAVSWILSATAEDDAERGRLLRETLSELSIVDPHRAFMIAQANSGSTSVSLEASVLYYVSLQGDIDTVESLLGNVSKSQRTRAYQNVGKNLIYLNQIDKASRLVDGLPSRFQIEYFEELALTWFRYRSETLVTSVSNLSTESAEALASVALRFNEHYPRLTEQEVAKLKSFTGDE